jgi:DnaK suppressor protein
MSSKVTGKTSQLDQAFLDKQRRQLVKLRKQILAVKQGEEREEDSANAEANNQAHEYEDDAQKLTTLELQGNLSTAHDARLSNIERALQKIDEGSYGLSELSGARIPVERLEASPEALYTLDEQKSRDAGR